MLELLSQQFDQLKVRCKSIRTRIEELVSKYMMQVSGEQEMRYLLLEKDVDERDSLDLITHYQIFSFLESQFAENVVKEIWRSPYATNDSIFTASTNYYFLFQYYNCVQDNEIQRRFWNGKRIENIENHPMQFTVWRYSGKSRVIIEFFTTLLITAVIHFYLRRVLDNTEQIEKLVLAGIAIENKYSGQKTSAAQAAIQRYWKDPELTKIFLPFFEDMMSLTWLSFVVLFFGFQYIADISFAAVTKKHYNPYQFKNLVDFAIFTIFSINIVITFVVNLEGTRTLKEGDRLIPWEEKA